MSKVESLSKDDQHNFSKHCVESLILLEGLGVEGDAHCGQTVKHRSRVKADPTQPNLRQVHLIQAELLEELQVKGFDVSAGTLGENILTREIDILALPKDSVLTIGDTAQLKVTGLRNPCSQLDDYQPGLTRAVLDRDNQGNLIRRSGIMSVVLRGGEIRVGDPIRIKLPPKPHQKLDRI
jgi:MOSC domain-containing protein YiiM